MGEKVGKFTADERGLHFEHAEIDAVNQPLYWIEEHWRSFLTLPETAELGYLRDWFKVEGFGGRSNRCRSTCRRRRIREPSRS